MTLRPHAKTQRRKERGAKLFLTYGGMALALFLGGRGEAQRTEERKSLPILSDISVTHLRAQAQTLEQTLQRLGQSFPVRTRQTLQKAAKIRDESRRGEAIQQALDAHCLLLVHINPEARVKVERGAASPYLSQGVERVFLVKIHNEAGVTAFLRLTSPNLIQENAERSRERWLLSVLQSAEGKDASRQEDANGFRLHGTRLEYGILRLRTLERGKREASFQFDVGQGTQDLGFRGEANVLFDCRPPTPTVRKRSKSATP